MMLEQNLRAMFNEKPALAGDRLRFARRYAAKAAVKLAPRKSERIATQRLRFEATLEDRV